MSKFSSATSARRRAQDANRRHARITTIATVAALALGTVGAVRSSATSSSGSADATSAAATRVPDSAYPIPSGARFVSDTGSDRNPGTANAPFRTISRAVKAARAGGTVVVRGGVYRESLGSVTRRVTIQSYPHEQVWMKGSIPVTGFVASRNVWVKSGWNTRLCHSCYQRGDIDRAFPAAGLPDQVFVDNAPLVQVTTSRELAPGRFYVDTKRHALLLGSNPAGHQVEATIWSTAMQFNGAASGSRLLGIGVTEYGPYFSYRLPAMVIGNTTNLTFDRDAFTWSATRGLSILRPGGDVEHSVFLDNGANGLHANTADGLVVMKNRFAYSNREHFSIESSATASLAAMKVTSTKNAVVKWNYVDDNASTGVWFDLSAYNVTIADNVIVRNAGSGVMYEVSARGLIAGNLIAENGRDGIRISGSNDIGIWNDTVANNAWSQLGVYDDSRTQRNAKFRKLGITWNTANVRAFNNVLAGGRNATKPLFNSFDATRPRRLTTLQMVTADGRNLFVEPSTAKPTQVASWQTTLRTTTQWSTVNALRAATGREQGSSTQDTPPQVQGSALPSDVASAMSVSNRPQLGMPFAQVAAAGAD